MSASLGMRFGIVAAVFFCLGAGYAAAQEQTQAPGEIKPAQQQKENDRNATGQSDRAATQQGERSATQRDQRSSSAQKRTANFRGTPQAAGNHEQQVERYLAGCLLTNNQAEIEIAEIAQKQSQNAEVKKFAEMLVQDHSELSQKLQDLAGAHHAKRAGGQNASDRQLSGDDTFRAPKSQATDQGRATNETPSLNADNNVDAGGGALMQLAAINKKITERCTQAMRDELKQKNGAEFDQCFVAAQVGGHIHMLAALEVIGQETQGQLQEVAKETQPKVQQHLEHAKQLAEQLKSSSAPKVGQAERKSTPTQR